MMTNHTTDSWSAVFVWILSHLSLTSCRLAGLHHIDPYDDTQFFFGAMDRLQNAEYSFQGSDAVSLGLQELIKSLATTDVSDLGRMESVLP